MTLDVADLLFIFDELRCVQTDQLESLCEGSSDPDDYPVGISSKNYAPSNFKRLWVTTRGATDFDECVAENFALYMMGYQIQPEMAGIFDEIATKTKEGNSDDIKAGK